MIILLRRDRREAIHLPFCFPKSREGDFLFRWHLIMDCTDDVTLAAAIPRCQPGRHSSRKKLDLLSTGCIHQMATYSSPLLVIIISGQASSAAERSKAGRHQKSIITKHVRGLILSVWPLLLLTVSPEEEAHKWAYYLCMQLVSQSVAAGGAV